MACSRILLLKRCLTSGMNALAQPVRRKFTFSELVTSVAELMKPYYNQQPQLVGPKAWRKAGCHGRAAVCKTSSPQKR